MFSVRLCFFYVFGVLLSAGGSQDAEAQIVRRFAGGGVQVNAPFVRVNVGPGGGTSVRAPFVAVDRPGRVFVGRRRRLLAQPQYAAPTQRPTPQPKPVEQKPEEADVDDLPYPTAEQLREMDDTALIETTREMMARFQYRLSRLKTGKGWQDYLVLSREVLGSPGSPPDSAQRDAVEKILPRYQSVQDNPEFLKITQLPSFGATFSALQEVSRRKLGSPSSSGPAIGDPNVIESAPAEQPPQSEPLEILPTPEPTAVAPNKQRGERSILKRK